MMRQTTTGTTTTTTHGTSTSITTIRGGACAWPAPESPTLRHHADWDGTPVRRRLLQFLEWRSNGESSGSLCSSTNAGEKEGRSPISSLSPHPTLVVALLLPGPRRSVPGSFSAASSTSSTAAGTKINTWISDPRNYSVEVLKPIAAADAIADAILLSSCGFGLIFTSEGGTFASSASSCGRSRACGG